MPSGQLFATPAAGLCATTLAFTGVTLLLAASAEGVGVIQGVANACGQRLRRTSDVVGGPMWLGARLRRERERSRAHGGQLPVGRRRAAAAKLPGWPPVPKRRAAAIADS